ncbi:MAG: tRNA (N6-isopentenyl adenosine(37)-C2)-methylthiotransferase MiaB [Candidatus Omnitrophica bacterium]|nr:tRNA (N6-isopentenyl adenosine(37)-C2)-methylthiotransferase MiaB [Candidatus Omnitrophota bacterium]
MKKLFVETYGCQMNVRDSEEVTGLLLERGYALTESQAEADVILFNTCAVREHAEHRVWSNVGALRQMKRERPELIIGVMGCMAKSQRETIFKRMPHVDFISGPAQLYEVPELIETIYEERKPMAAIQDKRRAEFQNISYHASGVSALVTVMEGCDKVCSYCVVPYTRGPEVSRPADEVIGEVERLAGQGYREVMLLGQNVNSYGRRWPSEPLGVRPSTGSGRTEPNESEKTGGSRMNFSNLLKRVNAVKGIERIRFITSHPWDAAEELFAAMRDLPRVCEHLHLPVQSGSDKVLERMRRGYTAQAYLEKLELLRELVPAVAVTTDVIVGFPGETEEDFESTVRLVEEAQFDSAFIFSYSPRPFAAASRWVDDVPQEVKGRRLQTLLKLQEGIARSKDETFTGQEVEVLVEEPGAGRTRTNRKVYFEAEGVKPGELVKVRVEGVRGHSLMGKVMPCLKTVGVRS